MYHQLDLKIIKIKKYKLHYTEKNQSVVKEIVKSLVMANKLQGFGGGKVRCRCNFICNIKKNQFTQICFGQVLLEWEQKQNPESFHFKVEVAVKLNRFKNTQSRIKRLLCSELQKAYENMRMFTGYQILKRQLKTFCV